MKTTVSYLYSVNGTWQTGNDIYTINEERLTDYDEAKTLFVHTKKNPAVRTLYLLRHVRKTETMRVWKNPKL